MGALPDNGILETRSTQLCVALFNAAHSLYSLNRCLETGSCLFWMSTKCQNTHKHTHPTFFSFYSPHACCGDLSTYLFFLPPAISLLNTTWPPPLASLRVWGVKCTINAIFMDSIMFFVFFFFYSTNIVQRVFFFFVCTFFFLPLCINLFVNM